MKVSSASQYCGSILALIMLIKYVKTSHMYISVPRTPEWGCMYISRYNIGQPSTREVRSDSSVAFLRPGGRESPIESSLCLRTCPPFFDFALWMCVCACVCST